MGGCPWELSYGEKSCIVLYSSIYMYLPVFIFIYMYLYVFMSSIFYLYLYPGECLEEMSSRKCPRPQLHMGRRQAKILIMSSLKCKETEQFYQFGM